MNTYKNYILMKFYNYLCFFYLNERFGFSWLYQWAKKRLLVYTEWPKISATTIWLLSLQVWTPISLIHSSVKHLLSNAIKWKEHFSCEVSNLLLFSAYVINARQPDRNCNCNLHSTRILLQYADAWWNPHSILYC